MNMRKGGWVVNQWCTFLLMVMAGLSVWTGRGYGATGGGSGATGTAPAILSASGNGTNTTFYGTAGTYGNNTVKMFSITGPSIDVYQNKFRFFGGSSGYDFFSSDGVYEYWAVGADNIPRVKAPQYNVPVYVYATAGTNVPDFYQNLSITSQPDVPGGTAAAMADQQPTGLIWERQPYPPFIWTTWFFTNGNSANANETFVTNMSKVMATNMVPWLSLVGVRPMIDINAGWEYTNSNKALNRDINGNFWWDTNRFPDGMPLVNKICVTNGVDLEVLRYWDSIEPSTFENNAGFGGIQGVTTIHTVPADINQLYSWGIKAVRLADVRQGPGYLEGFRAWCDNVLHPRGLAVANGTNAAQTSTVVYSNRMALYLTVNGMPFLPEVAQAGNMVVLDQPQTDFAHNVTAISEPLYEARWVHTNTVEYVGKGHWVPGQFITDTWTTVADQQADWAMGVIQCWPVQGGNSFSPNDAKFNTFMQVMTNQTLLASWADPAGQPGLRISDAGAGGSSVWIRPMGNGDYVVALANESAGAVNVGFSFSQLNSSLTNILLNPILLPSPLTLQMNIDTNRTFAVYDIFAKAASSNAYLSYTQNVAARTCALVRMTPLTGLSVTQPAGDNSTKIATTAYVDQEGGWTISQVTGSDATTTGQALVDVTGLTFAAAANTTYEVEAVLQVTTSAVTTGTEYGIQHSGTGAPSCQATVVGSLTTTTAGQSIINVLNTAEATAFLTTSAQTGIVIIKGVVVSGTGAGNITIRHLKVTSGTSTVKVGSVMKVRKLI